MKSQEDIEKRLRRLRVRYAHKYVQSTQERKHLNCSFNEVHRTTALPYSRAQDIEMSLAPRNQVSLVVLNNQDSSTHLCMYESNDPAKWQGLTCDSDEVAKSCPMFKPKTNVGDAQNAFLELVGDDEYVFNNHRDVATLQWVLGERIHEYPLTRWERLVLWAQRIFIRVVRPTPRLPVSFNEDLWDDPSSNT